MLRRGREGSANVDADEWLQFQYLHLRFLNTVEGWYRSLDQTSRDAEYRAVQLENLEGAVQFMLDNPGAREVWAMYRSVFPLVADVVDHALGVSAEGQQVG